MNLRTNNAPPKNAARDSSQLSAIGIAACWQGYIKRFGFAPLLKKTQTNAARPRSQYPWCRMSLLVSMFMTWLLSELVGMDKGPWVRTQILPKDTTSLPKDLVKGGLSEEQTGNGILKRN